MRRNFRRERCIYQRAYEDGFYDGRHDMTCIIIRSIVVALILFAAVFGVSYYVASILFPA